MYLNNQGELIKGKSTYGYLASGVPGTVAGLWEVHKKFGSLPWDQLLAPAIDLAENGFEVSVYMSLSLPLKNYQVLKKHLKYFKKIILISQKIYSKRFSPNIKDYCKKWQRWFTKEE